jgi:hypothetical protein
MLKITLAAAAVAGSAVLAAPAVAQSIHGGGTAASAVEIVPVKVHHPRHAARPAPPEGNQYAEPEMDRSGDPGMFVGPGMNYYPDLNSDDAHYQFKGGIESRGL